MTNVLSYLFLLCTILRSFSFLKIHDNNDIAISFHSEFHKMLVTQSNLLVDKTLFISDLIEHSTDTEFILRPPKWGKTFNLEMTRLFFDIPYNEKGDPLPWENRSIYFKGGVLQYTKNITLKPLKISNRTAAMLHMGAHPVLFLSFEGFGGSYKNFIDSTIQAISSMIIMKRYAFLTTYCDESNLDGISVEDCKYLLRSPYEALQLDQILENSFYILSKLLREHSTSSVVILLDDYDYPLRDIMMKSDSDYLSVKNFQHNFFTNTFQKGERVLYRGIVTGIFRDLVDKGIVTGTSSDLKSTKHEFDITTSMHYYNIRDEKYSTYFGFTKQEIEELLKKGKYKATIDAIETWYNGYYIGSNKMHNPYSVQRCLSVGGDYKPHWINLNPTGLLDTKTPEEKFLVRLLMEDNRQHSLQELYCEYSCSSFIVNQIDFRVKLLHGEFLSILNFLGYLTARPSEKNRSKYEIMVPNQEIRDFLSIMFRQWISSKNNAKQPAAIQTLNSITTDLAKGNVNAIGRILNEVLPKINITEDTHCEIIFALLLYSHIPWKLNRTFSDKEIPWDCVITLTPEKSSHSPSPVLITVGRKQTPYEILKNTLIDVPKKNDESVLKNFLENSVKNISLEYITNHASIFSKKLFECSHYLSIYQPSSDPGTKGVTTSQQVFVDVYLFNEKSERQETPTTTTTSVQSRNSKPKTIEAIEIQETTFPIMAFVRSRVKQQDSNPKSVVVGPPVKSVSWKKKLKDMLKKVKSKILRKTSTQPKPIGEEQSIIASDKLFLSSKDESQSTGDELFIA